MNKCLICRIGNTKFQVYVSLWDMASWIFQMNGIVVGVSAERQIPLNRDPQHWQKVNSKQDYLQKGFSGAETDSSNIISLTGFDFTHFNHEC